MAKWEYKEERCKEKITREKFIDWLNEEGQQGWELFEYHEWGCSTLNHTDYYTCIFKRKTED